VEGLGIGIIVTQHSDVEFARLESCVTY